MRKIIACLILGLMLGGLFMFPIQAGANADHVVDLCTQAVVEDNLLKNEDTTWACVNVGGVWVGHYSLFDLGSGKYMVYKIQAPAGQGVLVRVDYKEWQDVGNGGVHQYSALPKTAWYTKDALPDGFSGNMSGWEQLENEEEPDLDLYTYETVLLQEDTTSEDTVFYACLKFRDNVSSHAGKAGWNDGAWIDKISFETISGKPVPVTGVSLSEKTTELKEGESKTLQAVLSPVGATNRTVHWSSSDTNICVVRDTGEIIGKAPGSATVTVRTDDGNFTDSCAVTVKAYTEKDIVLESGKVVDTGILDDRDDPYILPMSWYYYGGNGTTKTRIVSDYGAPFRDFGSYAYAIYKLKVPAGCNAQLLLKMRKEVTNGSEVWGGIVSSGLPRLNIYYTTGVPLTHDFSDTSVWTRADRDSSWSSDKTDYTFTVSEADGVDRDVYVMVYSTFAGLQGAWIDALSFTAFRPTPVELYVHSMPSIRLDENGEAVLDGARVAVRYDDGSERILTPDEYTVRTEKPEVGTILITITMKGTNPALSTHIEQVTCPPLVTTESSGNESPGSGCGSVYAGTAAAALTAGCALPWLRKKKGERDEKDE